MIYFIKYLIIIKCNDKIMNNCWVISFYHPNPKHNPTNKFFYAIFSKLARICSVDACLIQLSMQHLTFKVFLEIAKHCLTTSNVFYTSNILVVKSGCTRYECSTNRTCHRHWVTIARVGDGRLENIKSEILILRYIMNMISWEFYFSVF